MAEPKSTLSGGIHRTGMRRLIGAVTSAAISPVIPRTTEGGAAPASAMAERPNWQEEYYRYGLYLMHG